MSPATTPTPHTHAHTQRAADKGGRKREGGVRDGEGREGGEWNSDDYDHSHEHLMLLEKAL